MEFHFPSSSRSEKEIKQSQKYKMNQNSSSPKYQKHQTYGKIVKQELDHENGNNDYNQHTRHNNGHKHSKITTCDKKHHIDNKDKKCDTNNYESYSEDDENNNGIINYASLKFTGSQPPPRIYSIDEFFNEGNISHCGQRRSSNDNIEINPSYNNMASSLKEKSIYRSNSTFHQTKKTTFQQTYLDRFLFNDQPINSSIRSINLDDGNSYESISIDLHEENNLPLLNQACDIKNKNEEESKTLNMGTSIPQIGYYKLERAESFNTHCIHPQNINRDEKKKIVPILKTKSIPDFKNQLEMTKTVTNNSINECDTNNNAIENNNLNKKADRYGWFITKSEIMTPHKMKILQAESAIEFKREQKWIKMIKNWNFFVMNKLYKIKSRIKKGIPDCLRSKVWQLLLDPEACSTKQNSVVQSTKRPSIQSYILIGRGKCCKTIEADLHRTMPHVKMFCDESAINSLREILHAYSNKDPEIGYYQGMAFLAAILLVYLDEVQAFWCFDNLMNGPQLQFRRLFIHKFSGLEEMNNLWEKLLALKFPKVSHNLKEEKIFPVLYTPAWFLSSYISLPFEPTLKLRIFDRVLMFGARALLSFGLTIIALNKKLLETVKATKILLYLQHPDEHEAFKDWRNIISKFDELWLSQSDYDKLFKLTNITKFF